MRSIVILEEDENYWTVNDEGRVLTQEADIVLWRKVTYSYEVFKDRHGDAEAVIESLPKQA